MNIRNSDTGWLKPPVLGIFSFQEILVVRHAGTSPAGRPKGSPDRGREWDCGNWPEGSARTWLPLQTDLCGHPASRSLSFFSGRTGMIISISRECCVNQIRYCHAWHTVKAQDMWVPLSFYRGEVDRSVVQARWVRFEDRWWSAVHLSQNLGFQGTGSDS